MDRVTGTAVPAGEAVFEGVCAIVAESLAVPRGDVARESRLIDELGADSLDFIDMLFMIERRFGLKVRDGEFAAFAKLDFSKPGVMRDGALAEETVRRLATWIPALGEAPGARVTPRQLFSMITVDTLCRAVERSVGGIGQ